MNPTLLERYQAIESTSERMVQAAMKGDWTEVTRLEASSRQQIDLLKDAAQNVTFSAKEAATRQRVLLSILRHDALIRNLAEPGVGGVDLLFHRHGPAQLH